MAKISVLLLAGGQGRRMGGQDKGLVPWRGEPLIVHMQRLVRPLTDDLIISCNRNLEYYRPVADQLVHDHSPDFPGPYAGILAGLKQARHAQLLVLPCDCPKLDLPLLQALISAAANHPVQPAIVRQGEQWEPLMCVIPLSQQDAFEQDWAEGIRSPRHTLLRLNPIAVGVPAGDPRLANLNSPDLLV